MNYDRAAILSLQLRSSVQLRRLSRMELLTRLQIIKTLDPIVERAFVISEEKIFSGQLEDAPHGHPWHTSFHASQFPGDDPQACPRQAMYRLMDLPGEPMSRWLRTTVVQGKAIEDSIVRAFEHEGSLISAGPDEKVQTGFKVPKYWLTGSVDCVIKYDNKPLPIEIKTKAREVVEEMLTGTRGPDPAHIAQLKTEMALVRREQENGDMWDDLDLVTHGYVYYVSRGDKKGERKVLTAEFRVDYDARFFEAGLVKLRTWKYMFEEDILPEENPGKRSSKFGHPMGWRWSKTPCAFCSFKKTCQLDFRDGTTSLSGSVGPSRAKKTRPEYDYEVARKRVKDRWAKEKV